MTKPFPLILMVLLMLSNVGESSACPEGCHCQLINDKFEMTCAHNSSSSWDWEVEVIVYRNVLKLNCKPGALSEDVYSWIDKRKTGEREPHLEDIQVVTLSNCPLPANGTPLKDIFGFGNKVKKIFFKYCKGKDIQRNHFSGLNVSLTHLSLIGCSIQSLPHNVFEDLGPLLEELDMHENLLESVPSRCLAPLKGLRYLELGNNKINSITEGTFQNSSSLNFLNLWLNKDIELLNGSLAGLKNLSSLNLDNCNVNSLPAGLFSGLENLQNISLVANNFSVLPKTLFSPTKLTVLKLFHNRQELKIPETLLANLESLKEVQLHSNAISELPKNLMWGSPNILKIDLQQNKLKAIPASLLNDKPHLLQLDLSNNLLEAIPDGLFDTTNKLQTIKLSHNRISIVKNGVLRGLHNLSVLDLSYNQISTIEPNAFPEGSPLRFLDLADNKLRDLSGTKFRDVFGKQSVFRTLLNLEELNLSNNFINEIYYDWYILNSKLKKLNLSHNNITMLTMQDMRFTTNVTVDLRNNNLTVVYLKDGDQITQGGIHAKCHFILSGNSIDCCASYDFMKYVNGIAEPAIYKKLDIDTDGVTCLETQRSISQTSMKDLLCDETCCSTPWECKVRLWDRAWLIRCDNCWAKGREPPRLETFLKCMTPYMQKTELFLHNNEFNKIPKDVLLPELSVTALHLSHNQLSELKASDISSVLKVLEIDHNNFQQLDDEVLIAMQETKHLEKVVLSGNPWTCNCTTKKFLQFLLDEFSKVPDRQNITCSDGRTLAELTNDDLCPLPKMAIIISSVCLAMLGVTVGLLGFLFHRYQQDVKVWLYARNLCLWFVTEDELDRDKNYDAFISYSHKDEEFVVEKLVAGLENGPVPFKLCLHYRDWIAGDWITEQIARSIDQSRRTLVVLSPNFLESVWGKMEFRAAHKKALTEGRARVIIVMYGDIGDMEKLDPELKAYLSTNTYVKWGDPWFWDKLRYALPHLQKLPGTALNRTVSDKMELIVPTTPSPLLPPTTDINDLMEKHRHCNSNGYNNGGFA